ncbi:flagellar basal-body MS-ring/collar protein FliF [Metabacillus sediminilitoris]|uniref:Flagellar M-ring protein n=1 Tax=Metabacillus sediminilitoris TaxID=2567941 RepID=A0A4S4C5A4_9BACI|nr:flagellar basal-body MS-ring/collar protein FliF [Metabacillus sediminilitoris]QGQ46860.1 flagellar basal body M-ring protein FliF [Metabacillus sediminilitoris]THF83008.1 flagellar basal body M-ring protein FliF [Metabacillus sediminilitoris]
MNEKLIDIKTKLNELWQSKSKVQKTLIITGALLFFVFAGLLTYFMSRPNLVPLYSNLSPAETGQIKETLDSKGIESEITNNGATILVPKEQVDTLMVELAAEGVPNTGTIDYSYFGQDSGFGMTDKEFDVIKLKATQTELANLMKGIEGVNDANVMITLPAESVFVGEQTEGASASVVLNLKPGAQLDQDKVNALFHLVSKSVPNLSTDNIVIMDQNFNYYDLNNGQNSSPASSYATQQEIKTQIEQDIQRDVQKMLGTMIGQDKVVVSVTTDIDFTQENREENLVQPVTEESEEGIAVSVERITEAYTGNGAAAAGGVNGTGETDIPGYESTTETSGDGDYERIEERINNEVNRINKQIVESPYKIRDIGIQVMVEPPDPEDPLSFTADREEDIQQILSTVIRTSINKDSTEEPLTEEQIAEKVVVSVQPFDGKQQLADTETTPMIPVWIYIVAVVLILGIIILIILLIRKRKQEFEEYEEDEELTIPEPIRVQDINNEVETEGTVRRKQLEKMAREKPEDFAKLLRTWISEE